MKHSIVALTIATLLNGPGTVYATGWHYPITDMPPIVKPTIVVPPPPVVTPPIVTPPVAPVAPPAATTPPVAPAQQPVYTKGLNPWPGYIAFGFVGVFFGNFIKTHMAFCVEDDKKPAKERVCYRPLRDGLPK